ncbi:YidC family membrane integrase SpoIIIJ [soil metagenome]
MFTTFIVQPIFNLLVLIYALLPGHNFGLSIIIFTVVVRMALWPLVKKQLHQVKIMRSLQPELKEIKKKAKGNKQQESVMLMELYKERGVNPLGSIGILIPQFVILIGLYNGLHKVVNEPQQIISFAYPVLQHFSWMEQLAKNIHQFDETLFGIVDLTRAASGPNGVYWPAMVIVLLSSVVQFFQSKQLMPNDKNARKLREILKSAGDGKAADQSEVQAAVSRSTIFLLPVVIFVVTIGLPAALGLYWLVGGAVAIIQQSIILREDETEMEAIADEPDKKKRNIKNIPEAEIVAEAPVNKPKKTAASKSAKKKRKKR